MTIQLLAALLIVWMGVCFWTGLRWRPVIFAAVLIAGLALNLVWMMIGLDARMLEPHALMAQGAATIYGCCSFAAGILAGRVAKVWRDSRVEKPGV